MLVKGITIYIKVDILSKNAKTEPGNYRPVSVLSIMSKVLEMAICEQLNDFIEKHDYLYELQSGFRSSYSIPTLSLSIFRITF